jgi:hypothetical protein
LQREQGHHDLVGALAAVDVIPQEDVLAIRSFFGATHVLKPRVKAPVISVDVAEDDDVVRII